jgi:hypothetical protein
MRFEKEPETKRQDDKEKVILDPATGSHAAGIQIKFFTFTFLLITWPCQARS